MRPRREPFRDCFRQDFPIALTFSVIGSIGFSRFFTDPIPVKLTLIVVAILWGATVFAGVLAAAQAWVLPSVRFPSFLLTALATAATYLAVILVTFPLMVGGIAALAEHGPHSFIAAAAAVGFVLKPPLVASSFVLMVFITMFFMVRRKLGPGVLENWVMGRYYRPREEERVFMFLDLRDSTRLGEELGNMKFSSLIQAFFEDLSGPILATKGEVSHYIGDEAVLCWKTEKGLKNANCLRCFYLMKKAIEERATEYERTFGTVPRFKAGAHVGRVVATQVGEVKSEIVYHGDVLNTTARTQGLCDSLGSEFLVTRALADALGAVPGYDLIPKGSHAMKGKEQDVELFAVALVES